MPCQGQEKRNDCTGEDVICIGVAWTWKEKGEENTFIKGIRLAAEEIKNAGGVRVKERIKNADGEFKIKHKEIKFFIMDNEKDAIEHYEKLGIRAGNEIKIPSKEIARYFIEHSPRIAAVIGHGYSFTADSAASIYKDKVVFITPTSTSNILTRMNMKNIFRLMQNNEEEGIQIARYGIVNAIKKVKKAAIFYERTEYAVEIVESFREHIYPLNHTPPLNGDEIKIIAQYAIDKNVSSGKNNTSSLLENIIDLKGKSKDACKEELKKECNDEYSKKYQKINNENCINAFEINFKEKTKENNDPFFLEKDKYVEKCEGGLKADHNKKCEEKRSCSDISSYLDAVFIFSGSDSAEKIIEEFYRRNIADVNFITSDSVNSDDFWGMMKGRRNIKSLTIFNRNNSDNAVRSFKRAYYDEYQKEPDYVAALGYDAVIITALAMQRAENADVHNIANEIRYMQPCRGATGRIAFDKNGDPDGKNYMVKSIENLIGDKIKYQYQDLDGNTLSSFDKETTKLPECKNLLELSSADKKQHSSN